MKRSALLTITIIAALCIIAGGQQDQRRGYIKPELRGAVRITPATLAPVRLMPQEQYFTASTDDPRYGRYKIGHMFLKFSNDERGNQVISLKYKFEIAVYNVEFQKYEWSMTETLSPQSGRVLKSYLEGNISAIMIWYIGNKAAPKSSIYYKKTAIYDWTRKKIYFDYNDPKAPKREFPLRDDTLSFLSRYVFLLKSKWNDPSRVYYLPYFDLEQEKYRDYYLKCAGAREKGQLKFESVFPGWGDVAETVWGNEGEFSFWVTPPSANALNGHFQKIIVDPQTTRYTIFTPATKEEALKPVRPIID